MEEGKCSTEGKGCSFDRCNFALHFMTFHSSSPRGKSGQLPSALINNAFQSSFEGVSISIAVMQSTSLNNEIFPFLLFSGMPLKNLNRLEQVSRNFNASVNPVT